MRVPSATYRIQFSGNFRFVDAERLVPYLHALGISHLYSSPQYQARTGSLHGYDVADPTRINQELGTPEEFDRLVARLREHAMGLLLDIVPNHMAASTENPWWTDVLEYGRASPYASYFDIDWASSGAKCFDVQGNKLVVPILSEPYARVLASQGIIVRLDEKGFFADVAGSRLPINPQTYDRILEPCVEFLRRPESTSPAAAQAAERVHELLAALKQLPERFEQLPGIAQDQTSSRSAWKAELWQMYGSNPQIHEALDHTLQLLNGSSHDPASFDRLNDLLSDQAYRLAYWRTAAEEVNYRRFFGLNDLVTLRIEDPVVFKARHALTLQLIEEDKIGGLRVDHIDGLRDPLEYLQRLQCSRKRQEGEDSNTLNIYTVVEKITAGEEMLPTEWPTAGTTGYDFLNAVNTLFIDAAGSRNLETDYRSFTGIRSSFTETWYVRKKQVMEELFGSDVTMLMGLLGRVAALDRFGRDAPMRELARGLKEITACLPIYRTYCRGLSLSQTDRKYLERAFAIARDRAPQSVVSDHAFSFLRRAFLLDPSTEAENHKEAWLNFLLRWQQFTGGVMAKGLEDTAFFVHHGLISLNEVGCNPLRKEIRFGVAAFHRYNVNTLNEHPFTLSSTSTHDTKWSEDVRARINVLSEVPEEWKVRLERWVEINQSKKTIVDGRVVPSPNEEVLLYQSMLGIWPLEDRLSEPEVAALKERIETFILKAAREAKTHSNWVSPNEAHEAALKRFLYAILDMSSGNAFFPDFSEFLRRIAPYGACNGFSQVLLKMMSPGVPDFFQGSELWNFRLTDPDNRHRVDFETRARVLEQLSARGANSTPAEIAELLNGWRDGRLKLYLTKEALNFRRSYRELFLNGDYLPLEGTGVHRESVFAFARRSPNAWAIVAVPRLVTRLVPNGAFPMGSAWGSTDLSLPRQAPTNWTNLFTGEVLSASIQRRRKNISLAEMFSRLPFAVLFHSPLAEAAI